MTFIEWVYSDYNTSGLFKQFNSIDSCDWLMADSGLSLYRNGTTVLCSDLINGGDNLYVDNSAYE